MLAEDLLQTALVRAWSAWPRLDGDPEPYVRRILVNTYSSWWSRRWRGEVPSAELPEPQAARPHDDVDDRDLVLRALGRLPRQQRAVLVLRYFEDLSEAQIAEAMSISAGAVKNYAAKALAKLRLDPSLSAYGELPGQVPHIPAGHERLAGVHQRVRQRRRNRIATAAAVIAVVAVVVSAYLLTPLGHRRSEPVHPSPTPSGQYEEGRRIAAEIPQTPFSRPRTTMTWTPIADRLVWFSFSCSTETEGKFEVAVEINGRERFGVRGCDDARKSLQPREWGYDSESYPEAMGLTPGRPVVITVFVRARDGKSSLPPVGTYTAAIAQEVPFEEYPLPSRHPVLEPLTRPSKAQENLRLEADGVHEIQTVWTGIFVLHARSQTPGLLWISLNGERRKLPISFWTYDGTSDHGYFLSFPIGVADPAYGTPVTITVEPQYLTGDWFVDIQPGTPGG
ncbi:hypothetical protein Rhe02_57410 [Rhizocola hellebori]|uniref:Sigma-70 family RNA polymerase sigma factor n=2 Tax=Rhizocola hellebori TaxID=1392758 RepID=A0A8J3VHR2_9ACTN|nr:hypothetical protein Rhe02_57410 [Rhizocola hellebori]